MLRGQRGGSPTVVNLSFLDRSRYFLSSSSSFIFRRLSGPRSRPTVTQKIWQHWESNSGPLGLQPGTLTTRPLKRSCVCKTLVKFQQFLELRFIFLVLFCVVNIYMYCILCGIYIWCVCFVFLLFCVFDVYVICILFAICFICVLCFICVSFCSATATGWKPTRSLK
jgi:hypothetical protein